MKKSAIVLLAIIVAFGTFYFLKFINFYRAIYTPKGQLKSPIGKITPPEKKDVFSVLLLGYGGSGHQGGYLTDTMILVRIDKKKKTATTISLPRDLWVNLPTKSGDEFHAKINSVYETELFPNEFPDLDTKIAGSKSDAELTKHIVEKITGIPVDYYIAIDFQSFTTAVDTIGGLDINVLRAFDDEKYPIEGREDDTCEKKDAEFEEALKVATEEPELAFPCRYEKIHFDAGVQHMDGKTALKFVRSRQSQQDGGDFARARRQQQLLEAVRDKAISVGFVSKIPSLLDEMEKYVRTDLDPQAIQILLKEVPGAKVYLTTSVFLSNQNVLTYGRSDNGQFILIPKGGIDKWKSVQEFIKDSIEVPSPTPAR